MSSLTLTPITPRGLPLSQSYGPFNVMDPAYGAKGDGSTDDTSAIQAAITAAGAAGHAGGVGCEVIFPQGRFMISSTLTIPANVTLRGMGRGAVSLSTNPPTIIHATASMAAPLITGSVSGVSIRDIALYGSNLSGSKGIYWTGGHDLRVNNVTFTNFGDQAVHVTAGTSFRFEDCFAQASLSVRTGRSSYVGVFDLACTDTVVSGCEIGSSSTANDTGNGYICAIAVRGDASFIGPGNQFEESETGVYVDSGITSGVGVTFVQCRADNNQCHGWFIQGSFCYFVACWAWLNSKSDGNSFDGFNVSGGNGNTFVGCRTGNFTSQPKHRYGFRDANQDNLYDGSCRSLNTNLGTFSIIGGVGIGAHPSSTLWGAGSPESVVSAQPGAVYRRTDGGAGTTLYVKESGTDTTGWVAK